MDTGILMYLVENISFTTLYPQLISRRARRNDLEQGRQVVELLSGEFGHSPNIMTFGVLALCCDNLKHRFDFLRIKFMDSSRK